MGAYRSGIGIPDHNTTCSRSPESLGPSYERIYVMILLIVILIVGFALIALVDFPSVMKARQLKEIVVYSSLFILAFVISLLQIMHIDVPSPAKGLWFLIENVLHIAYKS